MGGHVDLATNYAFGPYVCNNLQNKTESGTMAMTLSTTAGTLPYIDSVAGTVSMSGFEAASISCGGGEICNSCLGPLRCVIRPNRLHHVDLGFDYKSGSDFRERGCPAYGATVIS